MTAHTVSRRDFMKTGAAAGAGLVIAIYLPACNRLAEQGAESGPPLEPNAFLRIGADDSITVLVGYSEMGQGVATAVPMLVAEELGADWRTVKFEFAPADMRYANPLFGMQGTGGSTTVRASWAPMLTAGAAARELLIAAAAKRWSVEPSTCRAENGQVVGANGRKLRFGELVADAAALPVPDKPTLKDASTYTIVGTPTKRLDSTVKVTGAAEFGMDVKVPGALVAVVARCPVFGGKVARVDDAGAKAVRGVRHVVPIESGVAVVADGYWPAHKGREALNITWDEGATASVADATIARDFRAAARKKGAVARNDGNAAGAMARAAKTIDAEYEVPFLAHATMEPMNCTAHVRADGVDVWVPTQFQTAAQGTAATIAGVAPEAVKIHTTFLGGGFGRRAEMDVVADAVQLSKAIGGPVKVIWSREDDMRHDFYRPATYNVLRAALDANGAPIAYWHRAVGSSIMARFFPGSLKNGLDESNVEGSSNLAYAIPNVYVDYVRHETGVPVGFWRSVGNSQNGFIVESFIDELAHAAGQDPYQYRRGLLAKAPRHLGVLDLAAQKAGWGTPLPEGRFRGIAVVESFGSYVAEVAEVSIENGAPRVHRVVCAVDCGRFVNPLTIEAQMQSGIVYGLSAALTGEINIKDGRVVQGNFDGYPVLRMPEMPVVEVHIVPSTADPGGVGEPGTPPIAPAVANAVFAATGQRIRRLPLRLTRA